MAATAIAGHNKHGMISTVKGLYLYLPVCATIAQRAMKTNSKFVCVLQTGVAKPARACLKPIQAENQCIDSLSRVLQSHLPHPPLPHPRHGGSPWFWCNLTFRNLCSAHLRHRGTRWLWRFAYLWLILHSHPLASLSAPYTRTLSNQLPFLDIRVRIQLVSPFSASTLSLIINRPDFDSI